MRAGKTSRNIDDDDGPIAFVGEHAANGVRQRRERGMPGFDDGVEGRLGIAPDAKKTATQYQSRGDGDHHRGNHDRAGDQPARQRLR